MDLFLLVLIMIQLVGIVNGIVFFLIIAKVNIKDWIFLNSCSVSSIILILGYISKFSVKNEFILYISITLVLYSGCLGLYKSNWNGFGILTQLLHIIMIINAIVILYSIYINNNFIIGLTGICIGSIFTFLFKTMENKYFREKLEVLKNNSVLSKYL